MADRLEINHVGGKNGEMFAHTVDGQEWDFIGTADAMLIAQVKAHGSINPDKWVFTRCIYGSQAYVAQGCEYDLIEWEREVGDGKDDLAHVW